MSLTLPFSNVKIQAGYSPPLIGFAWTQTLGLVPKPNSLTLRTTGADIFGSLYKFTSILEATLAATIWR